jgi:hypothetical protein
MNKHTIPVVDDSAFTVDTSFIHEHRISFTSIYMRYEWEYRGMLIDDNEDPMLRGLLGGKPKTYCGNSTFSVTQFTSVSISYNTQEEMFHLKIDFNGCGCGVEILHSNRDELESIELSVLDWHYNSMQ